jgi:hypothetical protein
LAEEEKKRRRLPHNYLPQVLLFRIKKGVFTADNIRARTLPQTVAPLQRTNPPRSAKKMQEVSNKRRIPANGRGRKRSSPTIITDETERDGHGYSDADQQPPSKIARTFSDDFESSRATAIIDQKTPITYHDSQESLLSDDGSTASLALTASTATTIDMACYQDDCNSNAPALSRSSTSMAINDEDDNLIGEEDEEACDLAWIEELREGRLDRALSIPNEQLVHTLSSSTPSSHQSSSSLDAVDGARFSNEICALCKKPLVYSMNNEALTCPTEGCSPHVYTICDSTLASIAFGELVDFTYAATKQTAIGSRVCEEEIYGKKNKAYTNQDVINYLRVCIVKSMDRTKRPDEKIKSSEITANDIRAVCKAHGWTSLYSQGTQILCRMTGRKYPQISEHIDGKATSMFMRLKEAHQGARMKNCLYYWFKIYEILKQDHLLPFIRLVEEKPLAALDQVWFQWCDMLGWTKIPTKPRRKCVINPVDVKALLASLSKKKANVLEMSIEELMVEQERQMSHVV